MSTTRPPLATMEIDVDAVYTTTPSGRAAHNTARRQHHLDLALQIAIGALSIAAMAMITQPIASPLFGWGYVVGLASQPLWIAATWRANQWGMLAVSVFYTGAWVQGIYNHF